MGKEEGKRKGERGTRCNSQEGKSMRGYRTKMSGLDKKEPSGDGEPISWAAEFMVEDGDMPAIPLNR